MCLLGPKSTIPGIGVQRLASLPIYPTTDRPLLVNGTEPGDGSEEVSVRARDARIVVRFNHPVVPLVSAGEAEVNAVNPLVIEPSIEGVGLWIDTSTFVLSPGADLQTATLYDVGIRPGLIDQMGASLEEDHHFTFTTESSRGRCSRTRTRGELRRTVSNDHGRLEHDRRSNIGTQCLRHSTHGCRITACWADSRSKEIC